SQVVADSLSRLAGHAPFPNGVDARICVLHSNLPRLHKDHIEIKLCKATAEAGATHGDGCCVLDALVGFVGFGSTRQSTQGNCLPLEPEGKLPHTLYLKTR